MLKLAVKLTHKINELSHSSEQCLLFKAPCIPKHSCFVETNIGTFYSTWTRNHNKDKTILFYVGLFYSTYQ